MGGAPMGEPPPNNLVWAILTTIFCCLPLGIVSIVFAAQVNGKWQAGDREGAMDASRKARTFALWATIVGLLVILGYAVLVTVAVSSGSTTTSSL